MESPHPTLETASSVVPTDSLPADAPPLASAMNETMAQLVESLVNVDASISGLMAIRTELLEHIRVWSEITESASPNSTPTSRDLAFRSVRAEVACALRVPERTVENMFGIARILIRQLPATMEGLRSGEITYRHAQVIVDHASQLEGDDVQTFERLVVPIAATSTVATLERRARKLREQLDPSTITERHQAALDDRRVAWTPDEHGMGWLGLYLPVADGAAAYARATDAARKLQGPDEPRTLTQLRLDVLRDAVLCGTFDALGSKLVRPDVYVTVPVFSLMGLTDEPGSLDGYGPIDPETARRLAANAPSFVRLLTHPETGVVVSVGRDRYPPPSDMRTGVRVRSPICGFFGCTLPAEFCDIDHTREWQDGGKTELSNLAPLCGGHHTLKGNTSWNVVQDPGGSGVLTWTSPAGRTYVDVPESRAQPPVLPEIPREPELQGAPEDPDPPPF